MGCDGSTLLAGILFLRKSLSVITEEFTDYLIKQGVQANKIVCIPNWVDIKYYTKDNVNNINKDIKEYQENKIDSDYTINENIKINDVIFLYKKIQKSLMFQMINQ